MRADVVIVGAGIVGAACAAELASAGLAVCVIERDTVGSGATAAGMGHIVVMDDSDAQLALTRYSRSLWDVFAAEVGSAHEYTRCGTLWVAADDEEMRAVHAKRAYYERNGIITEVVDERGLRKLEPQLRPGLAGGLRVPGDSVVYPPRSAALLLDRALSQGTTLVPGEVRRIDPGVVELADGTKVRGASVVIANGARAIELDSDLPIRPKKGHLGITDRYPGFLHHQLVELGYIKNAHAATGDSVAFNVQPRATGQLLIGSSRQFDAVTSEIEWPILERMFARALDYLPGLRNLQCTRFWTGFRAATPDGLPLIGPHPSLDGVWLATGHEGLGITTSLATARLLSAQMLGQAPEIPVEPYLPARVVHESAHG